MANILRLLPAFWMELSWCGDGELTDSISVWLSVLHLQNLHQEPQAPCFHLRICLVLWFLRQQRQVFQVILCLDIQVILYAILKEKENKNLIQFYLNFLDYCVANNKYKHFLKTVTLLRNLAHLLFDVRMLAIHTRIT